MRQFIGNKAFATFKDFCPLMTVSSAVSSKLFAVFRHEFSGSDNYDNYAYDMHTSSMNILRLKM